VLLPIAFVVATIHVAIFVCVDVVRLLHRFCDASAARYVPSHPALIHRLRINVVARIRLNARTARAATRARYRAPGANGPDV
jgi:hypothetical protein